VHVSAHPIHRSGIRVRRHCRTPAWVDEPKMAAMVAFFKTLPVQQPVTPHARTLLPKLPGEEVAYRLIGSSSGYGRRCRVSGYGARRLELLVLPCFSRTYFSAYVYSLRRRDTRFLDTLQNRHFPIGHSKPRHHFLGGLHLESQHSANQGLRTYRSQRRCCLLSELF